MLISAVLVGKSAPRLLEDLLDYDVRYPILDNGRPRNLLSDPAPKFTGQAVIRKGPKACRHSLMVKVDQTNAPTSENEQPDTTTKYVVASYCEKCKHHFDITVDFTRGVRGDVPCKLTSEDNPMHHLRLVNYWDRHQETIPRLNKYDPVVEWHRFACSGASCPVLVDIKISSPRLPLKYIPSLVDAAHLEHRGKRVIAEEPDRYIGLSPLTPVQVFSNLRQYLLDAKGQTPQDKPKKIARRNKKYFLAFADECDDLFNYLDFKAVTEQGASPVSANPWCGSCIICAKLISSTG